MIVVATLLCDRKRNSQMVAIPHIARLDASDVPGGICLYVNIETAMGQADFDREYGPMLEFLKSECPIPYQIDPWIKTGNWRPRPRYDQDQARLIPIVSGRNDARDYTLHWDSNAAGSPAYRQRDKHASHLLFIDADVTPEPDGLRRLLALDRPLVGGHVPGRGGHAHVWYVFHEIGSVEAELPESYRAAYPNRSVVACAHGSCGYMLIRRDLLSVLSFRYGRHPDRVFEMSEWDDGIRLSEDPAFCADAKKLGFGDFWIDRYARAGHWDDPAAPFRGTTDWARDSEIRG